MAVVNQLFLFDIDRYRLTIEPSMDQLLSDDDTLCQKAHQIALNDPNVWSVLENFRYDRSTLGNEAVEFDKRDDRISFWLTVIWASFWEAFPTPHGYFRELRVALQQLNQDERTITSLVNGKAPYVLFRPSAELDPYVRHYKLWPLWARMGLTGWLDRTDVSPLLAQLLPLRDEYNAKHREDQPGPVEAFETAVQALTAADRLKRGLCFAILD